MSVPGFQNLSQMQFEISADQKEFLKKVDSVCKSVRTHEEECYLNEARNDMLIPAFSKIGMLGCPVSTKYRGLGFDMLTYALAIARIGQEGSSMRTFFSVHTSLGQLLLQAWGNQSQREKYLPWTVSGERIMAFALTEPAAGSDPASMVTEFEQRGSNFVLRGKKHWIGNGTFAGLMTTFAKERETGKISAFVVEGNSVGLKTQKMKDKIGLLTVENAEIWFDDCIVPEENLLGAKGQGLGIAMSALIDGRLSVAAGALGVMIDCLEECMRYSEDREQHGSPLAKKQLIQEHIAKIAVDIESSKWLVYRAAHSRQALHQFVENMKVDRKDWLAHMGRHNKEYERLRSEADHLAALAKLHASNCSFETANRSVQIFGSAAYRKTARVARHFLDSRATMIYEGANEVLELKIATHLLGDKFRAY